MTVPPFTRDPRQPPLHLRPWTPAEVELHRRMMREQEKLREIQRRMGKCS